MSARRHQVEQFSIPLAVSAARLTLGQMREKRDGMILRLLVLAGHRNQVVSIPPDRLEQIACVAVGVASGKGAVQMDWFLANEPAVQWARSLPSRRWRERLHRLRSLGERIVIEEMQAAPNARRISVLPPPSLPAVAVGEPELF